MPPLPTPITIVDVFNVFAKHRVAVIVCAHVEVFVLALLLYKFVLCHYSAFFCLEISNGKTSIINFLNRIVFVI